MAIAGADLCANDGPTERILNSASRIHKAFRLSCTAAGGEPFWNAGPNVGPVSSPAFRRKNPDYEFALTFNASHRQTTRSRQRRFCGCCLAKTGGRRLAAKMEMMSGMRVSYRLDSTLDSVNQAEEVAQNMAAKAGFAE